MNVSMWLLAGNGIQPDVSVRGRYRLTTRLQPNMIQQNNLHQRNRCEIAWVNPHAYIYINAKDASGKPSQTTYGHRQS